MHTEYNASWNYNITEMDVQSLLFSIISDILLLVYY